MLCNFFSDSIKIDFEVAEFTVDKKTNAVVIDLTSDNDLDISLSVRSTTSHWPVMRNNESMFDLAFYITRKSSCLLLNVKSRQEIQ